MNKGCSGAAEARHAHYDEGQPHIYVLKTCSRYLESCPQDTVQRQKKKVEKSVAVFHIA
jgi:hypothetical protein